MNQLEQLRALEREWRTRRYSASQRGSARGVGQAQRVLETLWRQIDALERKAQR